MTRTKMPDGSVNYTISDHELEEAAKGVLRIFAYMEKHDAPQELRDHLEIAYVCCYNILARRREREDEDDLK